MAVTANQIQMARKAGYSDDEIVQHLAATEPQMKQALDVGYKPEEIMAHFDQQKTAQITPQEFTKKTIADPQFRSNMAEFIRSQGKRDFKQEAVRGLPMGNRLADATLGRYNDPVHPERTVDATLGPQTQSATTGGAMVRGLSNLMTNPGPQIEGVIAFPADMATGLYKAATSPEKGSLAQFGKETVKGIAAPLGLADLASGDMSFPEARAAWEQNALGSGLIAYGGAKGLNTGLRSLKDISISGADKMGITPEKLYASSIKQSTTIPMEQRAANVKAGLEGGYVPNKKGLNKLMDNINDINTQIGDTIQSSAKGGKTVPVEDIISRLDDVKQRAIDSFGDNKSVLSKIDEYADSLREHPSVVDGQIPIDVAQKMKTNTYKQLKNAYGELKGFEVEAKKAMARGAKEEIVAQIPELADLNAKDSTLINLEKVLFKAVNRIENRDVIGIGVPIKLAAGAMHGSSGAMAGLIAGLIDTPAIKANLAIALHKARKKPVPKSEIDNMTAGIKASLLANQKNNQGVQQ